MFLKPEQVEELTDRVQPAAQIRWLRKNGYPYEISAEGRPKVLASVVESRLGGSKSEDFNLVLEDAAA